MGNRGGSDPKPCGVILAGGEGRRMGGADKALVFFVLLGLFFDGFDEEDADGEGNQ